MRYIVFDVETPNRKNDRMSAIGITVMEDDKIVDSYFSYVDPEEKFDYFNTRLTGIGAETVKDAPNFPKLWEKIEPLMASGMLVAHNAVFDLGVLKKCLYAYEIDWNPRIKYLCTVQMGKKILPGEKHSLDHLCEYYDIRLNHHQADSDSKACATILSRYMETGTDLTQFVKTYYI